MRKLILLVLCATAWAQQPVAVTDGTNGNVAVKPANTQPALADKSQVITLSPNNGGLPVNLVAQAQAAVACKSSGSVSSLACSYGSNITKGNTLIVAFCNGNTNAPTGPISETNTANTWVKATHAANGSAFECDIWFAVNASASEAKQITVTPGGSNASIAMTVYEYSGMLQWAPGVDITSSNTGSSTTAQTQDVASDASNAVIIGAVGVGTGAQTITPGTGWTNDSGQQNPTTPAGLFSFISMSQLLDDADAVTPSATFTSEPWALVTAVFHSASLPIAGSVRVPGTTPRTTDSAQRCTLVSAASTNATNCKAFPGNVYGFRFVNTTTTIYYLRLYNLAAAPTCSSSTGFVESIPIPPAGASGQAGGIVSMEPMGEAYSTGIGFCFTGGSSSTDNTNAAIGVFGTILYR